MLTAGILVAAAALLLYAPGRRAFKSIWNPGPPVLPPGAGTSLALLRGGYPPAGEAGLRFTRRGPRGGLDAKAEASDRLQDALSSYPASAASSGAFWKAALDGGIRSAARGKDGKVRTRRYSAGGVRTFRRNPDSRRDATPPKAPLKNAGGRKADAGLHGAKTSALAQTPRPSRAPSAKPRPEPDFDGRRRSSGAAGASAAGASDSTSAYGSIYTRSRKPDKEQTEAAKKFVPPKLSDWLGKGPLKPPKEDLQAPGFSDLKARFPAALPDGKPYERKTPPPAHLEKLIPPGEHPKYERWLKLDENRRRGEKAHWHIDEENIPFHHAGAAWGRADGGRWSWMLRRGTRWWTAADGAQRMVRHEGHWWWKTRDGWFLLHQGEPWAYRHFADWKRDGLLHPRSGARIVYSEDGRRVAVVSPDGSARVFDAATGEFLASTPARPTSME